MFTLLMIRILSDIVRASSGSCVTIIVVSLNSFAIDWIRCLIDSLITPSNALKGSSNNSILGFVTNVLARATLCFAHLIIHRFSLSNEVLAPRTQYNLGFPSQSLILSYFLIHTRYCRKHLYKEKVHNLENDIKPSTLHRYITQIHIVKNIFPLFIVVRPRIIFNKVVFPLPLCPNSETISPALISKLISSNTIFMIKLFADVFQL